MDAFNFNAKNSSEAGYKANEPENRSKVPTPGTFLGFFRPSVSGAAAAVNNTSVDTEIRTDTSVAPIGYYEPTPIYKGEYNNLSPLSFNTSPVDDATNSRLERDKLGRYESAQLFFLLRLERFLRLRQYWLDAKPRVDEAWKTQLALRGIYSALRDCQKHNVGEDGMKLIKEWGCC